MSDTRSIQLNGESRTTTAPTIAALVRELGLAPEKVAVEHNGEIAPRSQLAEITLADGDSLEIVHFVGGGMGVERVVPNRFAADARSGHQFYVDILGMDVAMELDFITTYRSPDAGAAQISVLTEDPSGMEPAYSVGVSDVTAIHDRAQQAQADIVYPLTREPWGVTRFMMRDPTGAIANVVQNGIVEE